MKRGGLLIEQAAWRNNLAGRGIRSRGCRPHRGGFVQLRQTGLLRGLARDGYVIVRGERREPPTLRAAFP